MNLNNKSFVVFDEVGFVYDNKDMNKKMNNELISEFFKCARENGYLVFVDGKIEVYKMKKEVGLSD